MLSLEMQQQPCQLLQHKQREAPSWVPDLRRQSIYDKGHHALVPFLLMRQSPVSILIPRTSSWMRTASRGEGAKAHMKAWEAGSGGWCPEADRRVVLAVDMARSARMKNDELRDSAIFSLVIGVHGV
jgi:hypothetical protein